MITSTLSDACKGCPGLNGSLRAVRLASDKLAFMSPGPFGSSPRTKALPQSHNVGFFLGANPGLLPTADRPGQAHPIDYSTRRRPWAPHASLPEAFARPFAAHGQTRNHDTTQ